MPATIVVGLGFGDEGKGGIVDWLVRQSRAAAVVRFNGGPQCGHHVVTPDGKEHTFSQFGAGSFSPGVRTILSEHMLINPLNLTVEAAHLSSLGVPDPLGLVSIDPGCVVVTPWHVAANRFRETGRGANRYGSCGQGVGEARGDALAGRPTLYAGDLSSTWMWRRLREIKEEKLRDPGVAIDASVKEVGNSYVALRKLVAPAKPQLARLLSAGADVVFEGAQGVLLDETHGKGAPDYATWTDTTTGHALTLIADASDGLEKPRVIGVVRAYMTRHGAGPFPSESLYLSRLGLLRDDTNEESEWQGPFRIGHLDLDLVRFADRVSPVDEVAVTCLDRITGVPSWGVHDHGVLMPIQPTLPAYQRLFRDQLRVHLSVASFGPTHLDKVELKPLTRGR